MEEEEQLHLSEPNQGMKTDDQGGCAITEEIKEEEEKDKLN